MTDNCDISSKIYNFQFNYGRLNSIILTPCMTWRALNLKYEEQNNWVAKWCNETQYSSIDYLHEHILFILFLLLLFYSRVRYGNSQYFDPQEQFPLRPSYCHLNFFFNIQNITMYFILLVHDTFVTYFVFYYKTELLIT